LLPFFGAAPVLPKVSLISFPHAASDKRLGDDGCVRSGSGAGPIYFWKDMEFMFGLALASAADEANAKLAAIDKSQAVIEFTLDGTIQTANRNFLDAMGYSLQEIQGKHHGMFVERDYRDSAEYRLFWDKLARGEYQAAQFKRIGKDGREVWIEAAYNPISDRNGKPYKVVKYATDISAQRAEYADLRGQADAIRRSQAVIEFNLDGTILSANQNFLDTMGYSLSEVQGKHHRIFVEPAYRDSADYRNFWEKLGRGEYQAAQFKRIAKGGKEIWIEASYNPILDLNGRPFKVVKFATDITKQVNLLGEFKLLIDKNFGEIDGALEESSEQATKAAGAVQEATGNIQGMAAAAEELAASVREIADMTVRSKAATDSAQSQATLADTATRRLAETSESMGRIISLIRDIAGQINLLALNATIESARAGDAGKGFAVVAGEVKSLAQQAANATNLIATEIEKLQSVSNEVVSALDLISNAIDQVCEFASGTASAVEEQSMVTQQISNGMQTAAASVAGINDNMVGMAGAVQQVAEAVGGTKTAARVLVR
jgi:methyl-accepting chemotaxis protein